MGKGHLHEMLESMSDPDRSLPHLPPTEITTQQLYALMVAHDARMTTVLREVIEIKQEQKEILETWRTAANVLRFVKLLGAFGASIAMLWALSKGFFDFFFNHPSK